MDIALLSLVNSLGYAQYQASLMVMKRGMHYAEQQAEALLKLMGTADVQAIQHAVQPHLGANIDLKL